MITGDINERSPDEYETALIGYTGFVGSNLAAAYEFTDRYNTSNIEHPGAVIRPCVSAAARADSHRINADGAADSRRSRTTCDSVGGHSGSSSSRRSASIPADVPGRTTPLSAEGLTPYGANRLAMEQTLSGGSTRSPYAPQLYGLGLRKGSCTTSERLPGRIHPARGAVPVPDLPAVGRHQVALRRGSTRSTSPPALTSATVAAECFGLDIADQVVAGAESPYAQIYTRDMRTIHADLYGGPPGYLLDEAAELAPARLRLRLEPPVPLRLSGLTCTSPDPEEIELMYSRTPSPQSSPAPDVAHGSAATSCSSRWAA